jgi:hypothetical protein
VRERWKSSFLLSASPLLPMHAIAQCLKKAIVIRAYLFKSAQQFRPDWTRSEIAFIQSHSPLVRPAWG